jgi:uncharacterized membrane protein
MYAYYNRNINAIVNKIYRKKDKKMENLGLLIIFIGIVAIVYRIMFFNDENY